MRATMGLNLALLVLLTVRAVWTPSALAQGVSGVSADCAAVAGPDVPAPADTGRRGGFTAARSDTTHAAVRLFASVQANEVSFARAPRICVRLTGDARLDSVHVVGRRNIASPVVAGTTYRDVYVAVEILGHLNAECIAARITGSGAGTANNERCASLGIRDSTAARKTGTSPP